MDGWIHDVMCPYDGMVKRKGKSTCTMRPSAFAHDYVPCIVVDKHTDTDFGALGFEHCHVITNS